MADLCKATKVAGKNIYLRNANEEDANFILKLRMDEIKNRYLSVTSNRLEDQINWMKNYSSKKDEVYFIVCDKSDNPLGCVRMYSPAKDSYCWGSWLMKSGLGPMVALESVLLVYAYGKYLGFSEARIEVRKLNEHVWRFHEKIFSASLEYEDEINRNYIVTRKSIDDTLNKYQYLLTNPLAIDPL